MFIGCSSWLNRNLLLSNLHQRSLPVPHQSSDLLSWFYKLHRTQCPEFRLHVPCLSKNRKRNPKFQLLHPSSMYLTYHFISLTQINLNLHNNRSSYIPKAAETTVSNPLGCAFVMGPSDSKGLPGTVVCGVCGAVRRYSFILQARKFGTFSCEPCRKFISRILRARVPVKCSSGSGRCIHPPVLRWNSACPPEDRPASKSLPRLQFWTFIFNENNLASSFQMAKS